MGISLLNKTDMEKVQVSGPYPDAKPGEVIQETFLNYQEGKELLFTDMIKEMNNLMGE